MPYLLAVWSIAVCIEGNCVSQKQHRETQNCMSTQADIRVIYTVSWVTAGAQRYTKVTSSDRNFPGFFRLAEARIPTLH